MEKPNIAFFKFQRDSNFIGIYIWSISLIISSIYLFNSNYNLTLIISIPLILLILLFNSLYFFNKFNLKLKKIKKEMPEIYTKKINKKVKIKLPQNYINAIQTLIKILGFIILIMILIIILIITSIK